MKRTINIGVLGYASIAKRFLIPSILDLQDQYYLKGIASRTENIANACALQYNTKPYTGYQALLDADDLDAVYIPLPNSMHSEWIETALERNLHVLVEKSMACTYDEVARLNQIASEKKIALVENFQFRFHRQLSVIRQLVSDGRIGELRCIRSSFGFPPFQDPENIRYVKELGGGALLDAGAYPVKIAQIFLGSDVTVRASTLSFDKSRGVDIWGGAYLTQNNGPLFAEIAFGFDNYYQCNLELWGSLGKIIANRIFTAAPGFSPEMILETAKGKEILTIDPDDHFQNMLKYFYQLITTGSGLEAEYEENIRQSELIEKIRTEAYVR